MLEKIHIENFKSLKDVTLDLKRVNLLIGPNNSGKSNFLKALEFLEDLIRMAIINGKDDFRSELSNYSNKNTENIILFKLEDNKDNSYSLKLSRDGREDNFNNHGFQFFKDNSQLHNIYDENEFVNSILNSINSVKIFSPNVELLKKPFPLIPYSDEVRSDCGNMISYLDTLRDSFIDNYQSIENDLSKCIKEFSGIRFQKIENRDEIDALRKDYEQYSRYYGETTIKKIGLYQSKQKTIYWSDELSEGTLYFLALLCIIHQPNPPKLLLLEEPERGIHPRRIKEVIDFIFNLAIEKDIQVIMTSHHPYVLNEFKDTPDAVFVFDKDEEGATHVKNLQKDIIEPSDKANDEKGLPRIKFTQDLADHWFSGFLGGVPV